MDIFLLTDKLSEEREKNISIGKNNISECQKIQQTLDLCNKNRDICAFSILKWYMYSCTGANIFPSKDNE